jgi:hypothetical protein
MIESNFLEETDTADLTKLLGNPLVKHGIKDKALWLIAPETARSLPDELVKIALFAPEI